MLVDQFMSCKTKLTKYKNIQHSLKKYTTMTVHTVTEATLGPLSQPLEKAEPVFKGIYVL